MGWAVAHAELPFGGCAEPDTYAAWDYGEDEHVDADQYYDGSECDDADQYYDDDENDEDHHYDDDEYDDEDQVDLFLQSKGRINR